MHHLQPLRLAQRRLDLARQLSQALAAGALDLGIGNRLRGQASHFLFQRCQQRFPGDALLRRNGHHQHRAQRQRLHIYFDRLRQLLLHHQRAVEAARLALGQHVREQRRLYIIRALHRRRVPRQVDLGQRHFVGHGQPRLHRRAHQRNARGQRHRLGLLRLGHPAEVLLHQRFGRFGIKVADHGQRRVGGGVVGVKELLYVLRAGGQEVLVRADDRPAIRVAFGVQELGQAQLGDAVGAVLVGLAALVAHDIALQVDLLVGHDLGQVDQALGLQPQQRL